MHKHIKNDEVVNEKRVRKVENKLNKHANFWVEITNAGEATGQTKRIKGNMKTKDNPIPILSGSSKDHKKVEDEKVGPNVRPIMGAMIGPNVGLSNFGCMIIRAISDEYDEGLVSKSTEETISKLENYNTRRESLDVNCVQKKSKVIIGSMDIVHRQMVPQYKTSSQCKKHSWYV